MGNICDIMRNAFLGRATLGRSNSADRARVDMGPWQLRSGALCGFEDVLLQQCRNKY
jgi:hypothetical protein